MPHTVAFLAYSGFQILDLTGPAAVFQEANHLQRMASQAPFYRIQMLSATGGSVMSSSGIEVNTKALGRASTRGLDTLLIAGGYEESLVKVIHDPICRRWVLRCAKTAKRIGSVCSGTFVLAALGILNGKHVTTHWEACDLLAKMYPEINVDRDVLYVTDGRAWTSAGVTTGIDMALAMVSSDIDAPTANEVAKRLVLYARRPGAQSQFSPLLQAQLKDDDPLARLIAWIQVNLQQTLDVPSLAARVGLSERTFYRNFMSALHESPSRFVENVRVDAARTLLTRGRPLKSVAAEVGLTPTRLRMAFERRFGVAPRSLREANETL